MLCHDLLLIEAWRDEVVPRPVARVPEKATSKGYSVLFHEATMPNMLGPSLNHEHAYKVMGRAPLLELIDCCMRKIMRLHYRPRDEVEKVLFVPAKELAAQLGTMGGSRRPQRRPACPPARVLRPWNRRGSVLLPGLPGPPGAPVTAAGKRAGAALGSCWWSQPGRLRGHCRWSAKCSVMTGGQLVSSRRLIGRSGPKSGSAGSSWRPQLTQISAAPQTMAPVLQDKPRHSTDLAELCSPILLSLHWLTASLFTRIRNIFCHRTVAAALRQAIK